MPSNPLAGQNLAAGYTLTNPTAGAADARRFKVAEAGFAVVQPDGSHADFPAESNPWVEISGHPYSKSRSFSQAGTHTATPYVRLLSGEVIPGNPVTLTIATATTARQYNDDGSIVDVTTYSDGRQSVTTQVAGALRPTFGSGAVN